MDIKRSYEKIQKWDGLATAKLEFQKAFNALETEVIKMKLNLNQELYIRFSTKQERTLILKKCNQLSGMK